MRYLSVNNVSQSYNGKAVFAGVDISVDKGEIVCLLGTSGCGKSTLLRVIAGLDTPDCGQICIHDSVVTDNNNIKMPTEGRNVGMVFQNPSLFPHLTAKENVAFGLHKISGKEKEAIAVRHLKNVGMAACAEKYPHTLSGGEQQRVALARALAPKPDIMLLDEPFANLDAVLRKRIREDTFMLLKELNITTIFVTHDPEEALRMADRIYVLGEGGVLQSGTPAELYDSPVDKFVAGFFGDLNVLKARVVDKKVITEFGPLNIADISVVDEIADDDGNLEVHARPEAFSIACRKSRGVKATISDICFTGITSIVYAVLDESGERIRIRMMSHETLPKSGDVVYVSLDTRGVFIFGGSEGDL